MFKSISVLKLKARFYVLILGLINILGFPMLIGCSGNARNIAFEDHNQTANCLNNPNDTIKKEKQKKDSIALVKSKQDSIVRQDSLNKVNKNPYKPISPMAMYGIQPVNNNIK